MKKLTPEQVSSNWEKFLSYIEKYIFSPRKEKLLKFYTDRADRFMFMPASSIEHYHSAYPAGFICHCNNVIQGALDTMELWKKHRSPLNFTEEELVFSAAVHDLGKYGTDDAPYYIPNNSEWHRKNQGKIYEHNGEVSKMTVPDRSILLLVQNGIEFTENEYIAIKTHDGMYDEANKFYLTGGHWKQKPKSSLCFVLHQADMMASRIEFEEWRDNYRDDLYSVKSNSKKALSSKTETLSESASKAFDELFKS